MRNEMKKNEVGQNLGWCPNDEKPKEERRNLDRAQDGVLKMRNQRNKQLNLDRTQDDIPMIRNQGGKINILIQCLRLCPNDDK